ncbi:hypothetical protein [Enterococcus faecium]|uniref:hypothetical protein n=1 Tax=Enterococcus faecium TaxID=1352 RepID=UPI000A185132|nr:hypothetical protein [Enterococcus faecium]MCE3178492.1 hypothetical protein [Enterococcus faecium]MCE3184060.1 hypothetical protein [Enterococcus faecium]MCU2104517.1 hypothetical protein [Enterococcus faecium]MCU2185818.1 hypothetical protein [Enterococcus faecium]MCU2188704.1 hypothetical protein [Enterococcus faecium]
MNIDNEKQVFACSAAKKSNTLPTAPMNVFACSAAKKSNTLPTEPLKSVSWGEKQ